MIFLFCVLFLLFNVIIESLGSQKSHLVEFTNGVSLKKKKTISEKLFSSFCIVAVWLSKILINFMMNFSRKSFAIHLWKNIFLMAGFKYGYNYV